eukprot:7405187-Pyramimonas_sp.AAC.1
MLASALRMSMSAYSSHASRPQRELHRGPQWQGPHAVPRPPNVHSGPPLTRFVAPQRAPPKAPAAASTCGSSLTSCQCRATRNTIRGPIGSSTEGSSGSVHMRFPAHRMFISTSVAPPTHRMSILAHSLTRFAAP